MLNNLLSVGFRPFFLGAAWMAVIWMGLWLGFLLTGTSVQSTIPPVLWHGHEMLFGFALAVVAGFVLTAMQNWTGLRLVSRRELITLATAWLAGRLVFIFADTVPVWLLSLADLSFLPLLWLTVARTLIKAQNRRNYSFIIMLPVFWVFNGMLHLELHGYGAGIGYLALDLTVLLITTLLVFMGGRVIPFFTANRLPAATPRQWPWLNWAATLTTLALIPAYLLIGRGVMLAVFLIIAAGLTAARLLAWNPWRTSSEPMLWILHLGYAWIPVGLVLLSMHLLGVNFPWSAGIHALMAGAMSSLILGMIARVSLGHSGRSIMAYRPMVAAFYIITLAAALRVAAGLFAAPDWLLAASGLLWGLAFLLYIIVYTPILLRS